MAFASIADELAALGSDSEDDGIALPSFGDAPKKKKPTPKQVAFLLIFPLFSSSSLPPSPFTFPHFTPHTSSHISLLSFLALTDELL
jgi:hypothetical protein